MFCIDFFSETFSDGQKCHSFMSANIRTTVILIAVALKIITSECNPKIGGIVLADANYFC